MGWIIDPGHLSVVTDQGLLPPPLLANRIARSYGEP
jgi:hypothetical protein